MYSRSSDRSAGSWGSDDPLASVLLELRLTGTFFCRSELHDAWAMQLPARDFASFHFCVARPCWLRVNTGGFVALEPGDLAFVPIAARQVLASSPRKAGTPIDQFPVRALTDTVSTVRTPGKAPPWIVVCGGVRLEGFAAARFAPHLPEVIVIRAHDADGLVAGVLAAMQHEARAARPGSATVMTRLAEVVVVHVLRGWLDGVAAPAGWLAALRDPQLGRALAALHRRPEHAWTVAELARAAGLSRSRFSQRFSDLVQAGPRHYVAQVQMHRAREILRAERPTIAELAARFGYDSEPAFARAFKRHVGLPPGAVRGGAPEP